ncbi:MAG TPA: hypothetical protein VF393_07690 [archaeon]
MSTKYGKKIHYFNENPNVAVEIERLSPDLSSYTFVTLLGGLVEVADRTEGRRVRQQFVDMIKTRGLSSNVVTALGYSPAEPLKSIVNEDRSSCGSLKR